METGTTFRAYAKVNLCLSIGAPIPEGEKAGFHPIASWMQCIDLFDEVTLRLLPSGTPSTYNIRWAKDALCPTPIDWPLEKDLAVRAHKLLEAKRREGGGADMPVAMEVVKRMPVGGGLGGGSADAAAVLLGLLEVFAMTLSEEEVRVLAMTLGSDVAFFADQGQTVPRAALVGGLGDTIRRVDGVPSELVLIIPPYGCPTGPVYKAFDELLNERLALEASERAVRGITGREKQTGPKETLVEARWKRMTAAGRIEGDHLLNDLALAAFRVEPRLGRLVTALSNTTREQAHVTGSGSCVFIPSTAERVGKVMGRVERLLASGEEFAGVKVIRTRLV